MTQRIALTGYSRSGKDEVGKVLQEYGYERRAPGDIIKRQLCDLLEEEMGINAFTENDEDKSKIRPLLEVWGEVNGENIQNEFFNSLPQKCVNTKLVRWPEARRWKEAGGIIAAVVRRGHMAATEWELEQYIELKDLNLIDCYIHNTADLKHLREATVDVFNLEKSK